MSANVETVVTYAVLRDFAQDVSAVQTVNTYALLQDKPRIRKNLAYVIGTMGGGDGTSRGVGVAVTAAHGTDDIREILPNTRFVL